MSSADCPCSETLPSSVQLQARVRQEQVLAMRMVPYSRTPDMIMTKFIMKSFPLGSALSCASAVKSMEDGALNQFDWYHSSPARGLRACTQGFAGGALYHCNIVGGGYWAWLCSSLSHAWYFLQRVQILWAHGWNLHPTWPTWAFLISLHLEYGRGVRRVHPSTCASDDSVLLRRVSLEKEKQ